LHPQQLLKITLLNVREAAHAGTFALVIFA